MANTGKDASGSTIYLDYDTGDGSSGNPYRFRTAIIAPPVSPVPASYTTSGTPSTWTQALASNTSRKVLFIQNPPSNSANIDIGFGAASSEVLAAVLQPGDTFTASTVPVSSRISCRSASASVSVIVWEA